MRGGQAAAGAVALALLVQGCATAALWSMDTERVEAPVRFTAAASDGTVLVLEYMAREYRASGSEPPDRLGPGRPSPRDRRLARAEVGGSLPRGPAGGPRRGGPRAADRADMSVPGDLASRLAPVVLQRTSEPEAAEAAQGLALYVEFDAGHDVAVTAVRYGPDGVRAAGRLRARDLASSHTSPWIAAGAELLKT